MNIDFLKRTFISRRLNGWLVSINDRLYAVAPAHSVMFTTKKDKWQISKSLLGSEEIQWKIPREYLKSREIEDDLAFGEVPFKKDSFLHLKGEIDEFLDVDMYFNQKYNFEGNHSLGKIQATLFPSPGSSGIFHESINEAYRELDGAICIIPQTNEMVGMLVGMGKCDDIINIWEHQCQENWGKEKPNKVATKKIKSSDTNLAKKNNSIVSSITQVDVPGQQNLNSDMISPTKTDQSTVSPDVQNSKSYEKTVSSSSSEEMLSFIRKRSLSFDSVNSLIDEKIQMMDNDLPRGVIMTSPYIIKRITESTEKDTIPLKEVIGRPTRYFI